MPLKRSKKREFILSWGPWLSYLNAPYDSLVSSVALEPVLNHLTHSLPLLLYWLFTHFSLCMQLGKGVSNFSKGSPPLFHLWAICTLISVLLRFWCVLSFPPSSQRWYICFLYWGQDPCLMYTNWMLRGYSRSLKTEECKFFIKITITNEFTCGIKLLISIECTQMTSLKQIDPAASVSINC